MIIKKLKNLLSNISVDIKELIKKFPLTMILIIVGTIFTTIVNEQSYEFMEKIYYDEIITFIVIWGLGTFFSEIFFEKKIFKIINYTITGLISLVFVKIIFFNTVTDYYLQNIFKILATYMLTLFFISIFKIHKNENTKFSEYIIKLFRNILNSSIIYAILAVGVSILIWIFVELILDGEYGNIFLQIHTLLFGLYYIPSIVYSISLANKKELNSFTKGLVLYVFLPLTTIAMFIIYIYIAKILNTKEMPKNIIFRILAGIFVVAFPIWNMVDYYSNDKKIFKQLSKILLLAYIPFLFLEIYSINLRISEYGITPLRYAGIIVIIFQIITYILTFYKNKEKLEYIYIVLALMSIICILTPLSFDSISIMSQQNIIKKSLRDNNFNDLSDIQKAKLKGAYNYLEDVEEYTDKKYLQEILDEETIKQIENYEDYKNPNYDNYNRTKYFYQSKKLDFDIEKYNRIVKVYGSVDNSCIIKFYEINQDVDFSKLITNIINQGEIDDRSAENYFLENNVIETENYDFYISYISLTYEKNKEPKHLSIEGYWLLKK